MRMAFKKTGEAGRLPPFLNQRGDIPFEDYQKLRTWSNSSAGTSKTAL